MEHENELKEALDFVSPSALTYDEWLMVGMALKDSDLPVTIWEQWSTRDAGRYHKGECAKKWESFHGGGASPVTARSVPEVVDELYKSSNIAHVRVAKLLKEKYL